jgi:hypothetical protein
VALQVVDAAAYAMMLAKFGILCSVFTESGMLTLLRTLVEYLFPTNERSPLGIQVNDLDLNSSMLTVAVSTTISVILNLAAVVGDDSKMTLEDVACCIRFLRIHQSCLCLQLKGPPKKVLLHQNDVIRLDLFRYVALSPKDSIPILIDAGALDIIMHTVTSKYIPIQT